MGGGDLWCRQTVSGFDMSFVSRAVKSGYSLKHFLTLQYSAVTMATQSSLPSYETLELSRPVDNVVRVHLNRPDKRNAMNTAFWKEMVECFSYLTTDSSCRCVLFTSAGPVFSTGLDLTDAAQTLFALEGDDPARKATSLKQKFLVPYQNSFTSIEKCPKPVVVAVQGPCVGGGIDLVTACDIRLCVKEAWFQIKEVDIGLAADVGTLQRMSKIVGNESTVRELVYTARKFSSEEANTLGLVSKVYEDQSAMMDAAMKLVSTIANKSPVAVQGSKVNLNYSRDHTVDESLEYMATWNMCMLQTNDIMKAVQAHLQKETPQFSKL